MNEVKGQHSLLKYYGSKNYLSKILVKILPRHKVFVDVFGGSGIVTIVKPKDISEVEVYNDLYEPLCIFFSVIKDKEKAKMLQDKLFDVLSKYKSYDDLRGLYLESRTYIKKGIYKELSSFETAYHLFWSLNLSYSGTMSGFSYEREKQRMSSLISKVSRILLVSDRFRDVIIENQKFQEILKKYDSQDTLFYLDPPYVESSRRKKKVYQLEMSTEQHKILSDMLLNLKGKFILSGYDNDVYSILEKNGVNKYSYIRTVWADDASLLKKKFGFAKRRKVNEILWTNYKIPYDLVKECNLTPIKVQSVYEESSINHFQHYLFEY